MGLTTYHDTVEYLSDFSGNATIGTSIRDMKRAVRQAMQELAVVHDWTYYNTEYFLRTDAQQTSSTVTYDHTGGTYERQLTLASGTWPSWAAQGKVLINSTNPPYDVATREDDTNLTLSVNSNPGSDVAAGTSYALYRPAYPLPTNFVKMASELVDVSNKYVIPFVSPRMWLNRISVYNDASDVYEYTIMGDPNYQNNLALWFSPPPSTSKEFAFVYQRSPREAKIYDENTGTVTTSSGSASVTGSGTSFSSSHVGSVIRFSSSTTNIPTGLEGEYPYEFERVITGVTDSTTLSIDSAAPSSLSGVKYRISDPIDVQEGVMRNAYLAVALKHLTMFRIQDTKNDYAGNAMQQLLVAIEGDNRAAGSFSSPSLARVGITEMILERGALTNPNA